MKSAKQEKMSKSRGNVVTVDEVTYGVYLLDPSYEFCNIYGMPIDYRELGVWQDKANTGYYYTSTRTGRQPVFLFEKANKEGPCRLLINGKEILQHPEFLTD